jgi:hypothetical protein
MTPHFDANPSSFAVASAIGRVIPNDVTPIDVVENPRIERIGLIRLLQKIRPSARVFSEAR